jgi:L-ascorbate metabolism protein UlaG (beta-lactamase superfamily)
MELTKHGHACVVLSDGDRRLVIDHQNAGRYGEYADWWGAEAVGLGCGLTG